MSLAQLSAGRQRHEVITPRSLQTHDCSFLAGSTDTTSLTKYTYLTSPPRRTSLMSKFQRLITGTGSPNDSDGLRASPVSHHFSLPYVRSPFSLPDYESPPQGHGKHNLTIPSMRESPTNIAIVAAATQSSRLRNSTTHAYTRMPTSAHERDVPTEFCKGPWGWVF